MQEKIIYVISGCNGAGKTTASYTLLPEILDCKVFVNADEIAKGLSPFEPESVAFEAGRIMLERIAQLIKEGKTFSLETTLSTKSYKGIFQKAINSGYQVHLLYFWLNSSDLAVKRVKARVKEGGRNIPKDVIKRRYVRGLDNLFNIYVSLSSKVYLFDNSNDEVALLAQGIFGFQEIYDEKIWQKIVRKS
ncbi:zeta toxin family protein [Flavobacterium sp.]|uniref:zeta toxin family protein n=1 Tax=Flavobacterium sp. TaxID=239 RepID=UPI003D0D548B